MPGNKSGSGNSMAVNTRSANKNRHRVEQQKLRKCVVKILRCRTDTKLQNNDLQTSSRCISKVAVETNNNNDLEVTNIEKPIKNHTENNSEELEQASKCYSADSEAIAANKRHMQLRKPCLNRNVSKYMQKRHEQQTKNVAENLNNKSAHSDKGKQNNIHKEDCAANVNFTQKLSSRNDIIEQLLLVEDDFENDQNAGVTSMPKDKNDNRVHIFTTPPKDITQNTKFFKHKNCSEKNLQKLDKTPKIPIKDVTTKGSTVGRKTSVGNVYNFRNSNVSSKIDPAEDIITKWIKEGKVCVTTHFKGRPRVKRNVKAKKSATTSNKRKENGLSKQQNQKRKTQQKLKNAISTTTRVDDDDDDDGHYDACENGVDIPVSIDAAFEDNVKHISRKSSALNLNQSADGSFSDLARSVILNQATKTSAQRKKLLDVALKFVSTPANRKLPPPTQTSDFSPILPPFNAEEVGNTSPWRVNSNRLPNIFHFGRNSENLPSFSSDFIPPTPRKVRPSNVQDKDQPSLEQPGLYKPDVTHAIVNHEWQPVSSFSSNDSNGENIPPLKQMTNDETTETVPSFDENDKVISSGQFQNLNHGVQHQRSPLKTIQITEVLSLPPWKSPVAKTNIESSDNEKDATNRSLFGFEEFINDESENNNPVVEVTAAAEKFNETATIESCLHEKLKVLKKFRTSPEQTSQKSHQEPITDIFDEKSRHKQRNIKEMLCSTMIKPLQPVYLENESENDISDQGEKFDLFKEPEVTFHGKGTIRTYVRPRRKRKIRHNFVMFPDSDISSEDEETEMQTHHKKRRQPKDAKMDVELKQFVHSFNEICNEVDQYELVVE